jgi:hypothetical protein
MSNKKVLSQAKAKLNSAKAPAKPKDIIYDPMGQWKFPGLPTRIPSSNITMQDVPFPVMAYPNIGQPMLMQPGGEYNFPNADYVDEYPQMRRGGLKKGKTSRNPFAINKAFAKHQAFRKPRKNVLFDPNSPNFQDGGVSPLEGNLISNVIMNRNKGVDFVDRAYALGDNPETPMFNTFDDEEFGSNMSHKMAWGEDDNGQTWMFPTIFNPNNEAIQVPNQYADYISNKGYKNATGMNFQDGGFIETELTEDEIQAYKDGGYIVEDISVPELNYQDGGEFYTVKGSNAVYRKNNGKWEIDYNKSGNFQPLSKGDVKQRTAVLDKQAQPYFDRDYSDIVNTKSNKYADTKTTKENKPLTTSQKQAQKNFDKNFKVTKEDRFTEIQNQIEKDKQNYIALAESKGHKATPEELEEIEQRGWNTLGNVGMQKTTPTIGGNNEEHISTQFPKNAGIGDYAQRGWEYLTNPGTALEYALGTGKGSMPFNINQLKEQGVQVNSDRNLVGNMLNIINPLDDVETIRSGANQIMEGNNAGYATAGLGLFGFIPGLGDARKVGKAAKVEDDLVDLWRIQEKGARPMSELAAEGKLGSMFKNEKAIKHFKDREEHFGQWFTKDKADLDWYKKDREFADPEIINLKVPKSKLDNYSNYNKSLSSAPDREFVIPHDEQALYKVNDQVINNQNLGTKKLDISNDLLEAYNLAADLKRQGKISNLPESPEAFDKWLQSQYNQRPIYRVVDVNQEVVNNPVIKNNMLKQGLDPTNEYHIAEYMGTSIAPAEVINRGRRSGGHDELLKGSNKDILYFAEDPSWIGPRYGGNNPYYVKTFADELPAGYKNQVLGLRPTSRMRKNFSRNYPGFDINQVPSGVLFEDKVLSVGPNTITPIIGDKGAKVRKVANIVKGSDFDRLPNKRFNAGGYIDTELTPEEIEWYKSQGYIVEEISEPKMQQGGTPAEIWKQYTGTPWSEAKAKGLTDGSAEQNLALIKTLSIEKPIDKKNIDLTFAVNETIPASKKQITTDLTNNIKAANSFNEAFTIARKELGSNQIFEYNGRKYGTNLKGEKFEPTEKTLLNAGLNTSTTKEHLNKENSNLDDPYISKSTVKLEPDRYKNWDEIKEKNVELNMSNNANKIIKYKNITGESKNYIIVDKKKGLMHVYKPGNDKPLFTSAIDLGASIGDAQTVTKIKDKNGDGIIDSKEAQIGAADFDKGNKSTGAGKYYISNIDPKGYGGLPLFNMMNESQYDNFLKTGTIENVATSIHKGFIPDDNSRVSNGCIRCNKTTLDNLTKYLQNSSEVYILPEDVNNEFVFENNQLNFKVKNKSPYFTYKDNGKVYKKENDTWYIAPKIGESFIKINDSNRIKELNKNANNAGYNFYEDSYGKLQKGQGVNLGKTLNYIPIKAKLDKDSFVNDKFTYFDFNDEKELKVVNKFIQSLEKNKQEVMKTAKINGDVYNEIAQIAFGIFGTESNYADTHSAIGNLTRAGQKFISPKSSSSPDYQSKYETYGAKENYRSVGLTQVRWNYLNDDEKKALKSVGITSNSDFLDPSKAALGTTLILGIRYNQQLNNEDKKDIWTNLPKKWNKRDNYAERVLSNSKYLKLEQQVTNKNTENKKDKWGRPSTSKWYGFNPSTKKYEY